MDNNDNISHWQGICQEGQGEGAGIIGVIYIATNIMQQFGWETAFY